MEEVGFIAAKVAATSSPITSPTPIAAEAAVTRAAEEVASTTSRRSASPTFGPPAKLAAPATGRGQPKVVVSAVAAQTEAVSATPSEAVLCRASSA